VTRIRRGGYVFVTWISDHPPRHVRVYKDGELVLKFDLRHRRRLEGMANRRILALIRDLVAEGRL
jgi:hypothetical protein